MDKTEKTIIKLAETYKNPDEFIVAVEKLFKIPSGQKGVIFYTIGCILHKFSYFTLALNSWNNALKYFIRDCNKTDEGRCYTGLGIAYHGLGDFGKAIEYHEKSLKIAIEVEDKDGETACYTNLGNAYYRLGNFRKAIEFHTKSLEIAKEIMDRAGESIYYGNLGIVYHDLGDFRKAIECHEKSFEIAKEIGDLAGESVCYGNLGLVYFSFGDFRKAIEYHEKSLRTKEPEDKIGRAKCYVNLGNAHGCIGNFRKVIEYNEESLAIKKIIGDKAGETACYLNLGIAYQHLGQIDKAIEYFNISLQLIKTIGNRNREAQCLGCFGNAYKSLGDFKKAVEYYEKSLEIARETRDIDLERITNFNLGITFLGHNHELAFNYFKNSIELSELISDQLIEEEHKIGYYAQAANSYQAIVPLCLELNRNIQAFEYTERSKSKAFLDLLATTEIKSSVELTNELKTLIKEEEIHLSKLREIQTRRLRKVNSSIKIGEVDEIFLKLNDIYNKIEEFDPTYVFIRRGRTLHLSKIQEILLQKRNAILIEYFITENYIIIFVISPQELHVKTIPISAKIINQYIENYWKEIINYRSFGDIGNTWIGLSKYLIEPISEFLSESELIYFVPYGSLHYFPMHALELNGEPLIKNHAVAYSPIASLLKLCKDKGSSKIRSCASFGVDFEKEAEDVAEFFHTKAYLKATKDIVYENVNKDVLHFSCHGYFDDIDPLSSGVKLCDGVLTAREIFNLRLNTELVTLSACQTGINERRPGDELIGLTRAFLYAGTPSVIVSLWSVDSLSTKELMIEFYKLLTNGKDKADALQEAQKIIMEKKEYSHPYYWAPFVLIGDWE